MNAPEKTYIDRLLTRLQNKLAPDDYPLIATFARLFWARTLEEDLASRGVSNDAGATIEAWRRLCDRQGDDIHIHLINPVSARDGWQSSHSIVIVVAPNMPFMVDSVLMALSHDGLVTHHLNNVVLAVDRNAEGDIRQLALDLEHPNRELLIYAEIDRLNDEALPDLNARLETTVAELRAVVEDFGAMKDRVSSIVETLRTNPPPLAAEEVEESIAFLEWLQGNHFTFLGCREFEYVDAVIRQTGTSLGMHRVRAAASERRMDDQPARTQEFLMAPTLLSFSKSGTKSRVHRPAYPDYVGIKRFDEHGQVIGEVGLAGLYTSRVYMEFPERIPVVRRKVANVLQRSGLDPAGFDGKVLAQVIATYPRDELFQISEDDLVETTMVITDIHERRRVRVFPRFGAYGLFVNILVYMPRDLFSTAIRLKLRALLVETFDAEDADHDILLSESILVRVQYTLRIRPGDRPEVDRVELEKRITELIGDWVSDLNEALLVSFGETQGRNLQHEYANAFTAGYREQFEARAAVDDIASIEALSDETSLSTRFYRLPEDPDHTLRLKIFHSGDALPLSDVIPKLENMGLRVIGEHPYPVRRKSGASVAVHDYELQFEGELDLQRAGIDFDQAFVRMWDHEVEDDTFNRLILAAGLSWRQISVLRAYAQYIKQIRFGFSQAFISDTLFRHQTIAEDLVRFFESRFRVDTTDPGAEVQQFEDPEAIARRITHALDGVALLNEDRILRRFLEIMRATKRTNYFVTDSAGHPRPYLSLKLVPREIADVPRPRPMFEIFVTAPHVEGVHLRGGSIARGGLRWSDRLEDYRTEVLGLVKAQVVKNAVIVPTGAKGGFVAKSARDGIECYRDFIRGLLDLTDNIVDGEVTPPARVRVHDGSDPYLVVAADKGTATFSDAANEVADEYAFWLGDAFASGGSFGYDHKKMGITARGAWVSVQRHFAEMNIDVQKQPITVLGIGDMAGDVFGNGMLSSRCLKLVAAFNHKNIFIDPDPQPERSFAERQRLFDLPRSSWTDYNPDLISEGGGVYPRDAKSIEITPHAGKLFNIKEPALAPDELINRLLMSPVQLVWNGGIGTYVKASAEVHADVGDRANDHLRVNANQLRCRVFGEGGNLGMTQRARIEFSLAGGAVNTDFIDNSAGVDCSDHEVNIKIALNDLVTREDMTRKQRNALLEQMTDAVAELVLENNYNQAQTLSLAMRHAANHGAEYQRLISSLSQHAGLDRELEFLPSDDVLSERYSTGLGLTRPELAVLLTYSKTHIKTSLISSDAHLEPLLAQRVFTAFPEVLRNEYTDSLRNHRLAREIIATQLANEIVDHMGIGFVTHLIEFVGGTIADAARAYAVVAECFEFNQWFDDVRELATVAAQTRLTVLLELARLGRSATRWMLRHGAIDGDLQALVGQFKQSIASLLQSRDGAIGERGAAWRARKADLVASGLPEALARKSANAADLARLLPMIDIARRRNCDEQKLAEVTSRVGDEMHIDWLAAHMMEILPTSHWQAMERESLLDDLFTRQNLLGALVLEQADGNLRQWLTNTPQFAQVWNDAIDDVRHASHIEFSLYAVAIRKLADLCTKQGC